jgi:toxin ParE1/3/4
MTGYILSFEALEDINDIWMYTAEKWSVEQADRYYNLIFDEIEYIVENFEMARDFSRIKKDYRYTKVKSHLIFFKKADSNLIEIVRVLHEKMDIENRLTD